MGGDQPHFEPLLLDAWRRADVCVVAADAGYDSEANHRIGWLGLGVRPIIPPLIGRPSDEPLAGQFRRLMQQRFGRDADKSTYGQRWQLETANSVIKRNLGSALRARTARRRSMELLLCCITHNIMVLEGTQPKTEQSRTHFAGW